MKYGVIISAAAGLSLAVSGPAFAQQSNGKQTREQARQSSQGPDNANERGVRRSNENSVLKGGQSGQEGKGTQMREKARKNGQGPNASERGRERANQNSAINVQPGMMVHDQNGKMLGKVREVRRSADGTIIAIIVVLVVQINGSNIIELSPELLSIVNNVLVTTQITAPSGS
ncbi:MAG: hypothetical protein M3N39_08915 [Pseudomonadota bacterium]|nr:hypothetical protein [Pseudomonadota bacterium]